MGAQGRAVFAERVDLDRVVFFCRADARDEPQRPRGRGDLDEARRLAVPELERPLRDHRAARAQRGGSVCAEHEADGLCARDLQVHDDVADARTPALLRQADRAPLSRGALRGCLGREGALRGIRRGDRRLGPIERPRFFDARHRGPRRRSHDEGFADASARGALPVGLRCVPVARREALQPAREKPLREGAARIVHRAGEARSDGRAVLRAVRERRVPVAVGQRRHRAQGERVDRRFDRRDLPGVSVLARCCTRHRDVGADRVMRFARRVDAERFCEGVRQRTGAPAGRPGRRSAAGDEHRHAESQPRDGARSRAGGRPRRRPGRRGGSDSVAS